MSGSLKEQRRIAAAHLCEVAARMIRSGDYLTAKPGVVTWLLMTAARIVECRSFLRDYRFVLRMAGVAPVDVDAAVSAIARGEHPPDSLPGQVATIRDRASVPGHPCPRGETEWNIYGRRTLAIEVLALLGCEVKP